MNLYIPLDMTGSERSHGSHSYVCKLHTKRPTCRLIFRTQRRTQSDKKVIDQKVYSGVRGQVLSTRLNTLYFSLMTFMNVKKKKLVHLIHITWRQQIKLWHIYSAYGSFMFVKKTRRNIFVLYWKFSLLFQFSRLCFRRYNSSYQLMSAILCIKSLLCTNEAISLENTKRQM